MFLRSFNGVTYIAKTERQVQMQGMFSWEQFFSSSFQPFERSGQYKGHGVLRAVPVVLAIKLLSNEFKKRKILYNVENLSMFTVINKRTTQLVQTMPLEILHLVSSGSGSGCWHHGHEFSRSNSNVSRHDLQLQRFLSLSLQKHQVFI